MGKKLSSDNSYGKIMIRLEKPKYVAGDQVNGVIYLDLTRAFPANTLNLIISGKERVNIVETKNEYNQTHNRYDTKVEVHKEKNEFYGHTFPIYSFAQAYFPPGQYTFPFSFKLLDSLPSSFSHNYTVEGNKGYGKITYKIFAGFKSPNSPNTFFEKVKFVVDQKFEFPTGPVERQFAKDMNGYCYQKIGMFSMRCQFDRDKFVVGENAAMNIEVDNSQCKVDVKQIKCDLVQSIEMKTSNNQHRYNFSKVISQLTLPGIKAGERRIGTESIPVTMRISTDSDQQATCSGNMIKNSFSLRISNELDACLCCESHPTSAIDVKIYNRNAFVPPPAQMAPNWSPQQMNPYVCTMTNDYRMTADLKKELHLDEETNYPAI